MTAPQGTEPSLRLALARAAAGLPVDDRGLPAPARRALQVADRLGAPRGPALEAAIATARDRTDLRQAVEVAAAEGRSVARVLVLAPPVLGPLTALLVSDAPFAVWTTGPGRLVLLLAAVLWGAGWLVVRGLVRRATTPPAAVADGPDDAVLDLVAVALAGGASVPHALRLAGPGDGAAARVAMWFELGGRGPLPSGWDEVAHALALARADGVPLAGLVRALAADRRRDRHHLAMQAAARLGARLTLPTTLLLLPAAGLVVAAPLLHGVLQTLR